MHAIRSISSRACALVAFGGAALFAFATLAGAQNAAPTPRPPLTGVAKTADAIPFINGSLNIPSMPRNNNRGVITEQTVAGVTHTEAYVYWRYLEPRKDRWDFREFDEVMAINRNAGLKILVLPWVEYPPEWFTKTPDYQPLVEMTTGKSVYHLSPWAPGTLAAYDHFYAGLARKYPIQIDIIKLGYPGSVFGEVGLSIGGKITPGSFFDKWLPQDPDAWKPGYWCGDPYARADFRERMLARYGSLEKLNGAWGTDFAATEAIAFPNPVRPTDPALQSIGERRRWVDFITWIQDSQVRTMAKLLEIIRKHFPHTMLDIPLGFGSDLPSDGCDRTAIVRAAADFKPVTVRSTHGSFNRENMPRAYWFYKRMAPLCHRLGVGFGTEPPGGDLSRNELRRQYFEDAGAGANYIFHYFQNYHLFPDVVGDYKRILRPQERSRVDIAVLDPTTQMIIDMSHFPGWPRGQIYFCDQGREYFDYDVVDENLIDWGMLMDYKVLLHTSGMVWREATLPAIDRWLKNGGILVTHGVPQWTDLAGRGEVAAAWLTDEDKTAVRADRRVFRVGKGRLYAVSAGTAGAGDQTAGPPDTTPDPELAPVVTILRELAQFPPWGSPLHGFDGQNDGKRVTEFPDGQLVFDAKTLATVFVPKAGRAD